MSGRMAAQERAAVLMRLALSLLDEAGGGMEVGLSAVHLVHAIESLPKAATSSPASEVDRTAVLSDPSLVRAVGGALTVLAGLIEGKGVASVEEIAKLLGIYSVVTGETAPDEGLILACWAGMLQDIAQQMAKKNGEPLE